MNLIGDCQGGWLAVVYAALHADQVNTLTIGGAPIDTHAGQSAIQEWTRMLARRNELGLYRALVRAGGGVQRGENQLTGFKLLEPGAEIERLMGLLANIRDPDYVTRHIDFTNWLEWTQLVDAGHLGLFMGRAALAEHWTPIAERVRVHSERDG